MNKYRIRMRYNDWYLYLYDADGSSIGEMGPYGKYVEAERAAKYLEQYDNYIDWDKNG